jgi:hypothetical protein
VAAFLRRNEVLPDEAVVVRGGVLPSLEAARESAEDCFEEMQRQSGEGVYGISVCSLPDRTAEQILRDLQESNRLPHPKIRQTSVGRLRGLGFDVWPSGWFGHATLEFSRLPTEQDWERIQLAFRAPERNPVKKIR